MLPLQSRLDDITQNTRKLVQPERLAISESLIADLFASGVEDTVLPVGSIAPGFRLPDAISGRPIGSADLLALGPLIVNFFRGRWDPYCVTELETWRDLYPAVRERGALLVGISPQTLRQSDFAVQQHGIPFPLLRDEDCRLAGEFGIAYTVSPTMEQYYRSILVNLSFINGGRNVMTSTSLADGADTAGAVAAGPCHLPLPATFVINRNGEVLFSEGHADFRVRPEPSEVLSVLSHK